MRFALVVEYDGTEFSGSQFQANARTVQGELERAAGTIFGGGLPRVKLASRTDAGVHAVGQVAAIDLDTQISSDVIRNAFNGNLPDDVRVHYVKMVPDGFDPRRDAIAREYRYVINDGATSSPIRRRTEYHVRSRLDAVIMDRAARHFEGVHDFASFAAATKEPITTIRRVETAIVHRRDDERIVFDIRANAFVRQQIRRMVGVLIAVGRGTCALDEVARLLSRPKRDSATQNAPPHGLTLTRVVYGAESGIPEDISSLAIGTQRSRAGDDS